jgi:4-carboxymuconolactone decarboxylase
MSRIQTRPTSPAAKAVLAIARRSVAKLTGRDIDDGLGPLRAYGLAPRLLISYGMFEQATAGLRRVPVRLKMLAELKAATMTTCPYCIDIGSQIARRSGLSEAQLLALADYRESAEFDALEKLVLDYAVAMSRTPVEVSDELFDALRAHFDDAQLVELTNTIALENMRGRFNHALGFGAAGYSEGMACAVPATGSHAGDSQAQAHANGATSQAGAESALASPAG